MIDQIQKDLKEAQLARDERKVSTLRLLIAEINNARIDKGELTDIDITQIIQREVKKRKEAAEGFRSGNRENSAKEEEAEAKILGTYLPQQLSDEELTKIIEEVINEVDAKSMADMGKVIGQVMSKVSGQADGGRVSGIVKQKLS